LWQKFYSVFGHFFLRSPSIFHQREAMCCGSTSSPTDAEVGAAVAGGEFQVVLLKFIQSEHWSFNKN
jgi:hypothetical protein